MPHKGFPYTFPIRFEEYEEMALNTVTLLALEQKISEAIGDWLEFDTTTNITTNTSVISTTLRQFDNGRDDTFNNWWLYITEGNNITVERKVSDYATATGTLTVYGANLAAESGAVTCRIHRYQRTGITKAIVEACKESYPSIHKRIDNMTLITGNILPDNSFESWASTASLNYYTGSATATLLKTTTAGLIRGQRGSTSTKLTAGAASDYYEITSDTWPQLLDLMGRYVDFYTWAYPEVANDAKIQIYTLKADGTAQTLTSTTACPAAKWTELELESQSLNDDLVYVRIRWIVTTNAKYAYFDDAFLVGMPLSEYIVPAVFYGGRVDKLWIQTIGYSDEAAYDLQPFMSEDLARESAFNIISDGTDLYLKLSTMPTTGRRMRLFGIAPVESLSADADTITIDNRRVPLLIAKARMIFFSREATPASVQDSIRFEKEYYKAERDYRKLVTLQAMPIPQRRYLA